MGQSPYACKVDNAEHSPHGQGQLLVVQLINVAKAGRHFFLKI